MSTPIVDQDLQSIQEVHGLVRWARKAYLQFKKFTQEGVDRVVAAVAKAGFKASERLAVGKK